MRRRSAFAVFAVLIMIFSACGKLPDAKNSLDQKLAFPFEFASDPIDYPDNVKFAEISVPEFSDEINDLAEAVDAASFLTDQLSDTMYYHKIGDDLRKDFESDMLGTLGRALQIAPIGHNFLYSYDDQYLEDGLIGIRAPLTDDYATTGPANALSGSAVNYEFYKNSLQKETRNLSVSDLPLAASGAEYLKVSNSEQLFYAVLHNYIPYCMEGSAAYEIFQKSLQILSSITAPDMSETELYKSIYQYVLQSCHYDYDTLLDGNVQNRTNRAFFLEGSVLDGYAICDGLCKEIVLLSRLMGLEAYHVGARSADSGHAYIYVKIDGGYYLSCPTYGSNRYPLKDGSWQDYHTNNYLLTDYDTNMAGWPYDSDAYPDIKAAMQNTRAFDYWAETFVDIDGSKCDLNPDTADEAMVVLNDALDLQKRLGMPVEVELCGRVDVLREAYSRLKDSGADVVYLSGGTFEGRRLQVYLLGAGQ